MHQQGSYHRRLAERDCLRMEVRALSFRQDRIKPDRGISTSAFNQTSERASVAMDRCADVSGMVCHQGDCTHLHGKGTSITRIPPTMEVGCCEENLNNAGRQHGSHHARDELHSLLRCHCRVRVHGQISSRGTCTKRKESL